MFINGVLIVNSEQPEAFAFNFDIKFPKQFKGSQVDKTVDNFTQKQTQ